MRSYPSTYARYVYAHVYILAGGKVRMSEGNTMVFSRVS